MSNPLPKVESVIRRGGLPEQIEPDVYPGLADLRPHCSKDGPALIDRAYRDALDLHRRLRDAEAELELYRFPALAEHARQENAMQDLTPDPVDGTDLL